MDYSTLSVTIGRLIIMSIDVDLLSILCCPETKQPVSVAESILVQKINSAIVRGELKNKGNRIVTGPIESGLIRNDMKVLYPVRDNIPVMLIEEGIPLEQVR
jgi:uncharacterized protein